MKEKIDGKRLKYPDESGHGNTISHDSINRYWIRKVLQLFAGLGRFGKQI